MGTLLRNCAQVREPIELPFRVVSGLGKGGFEGCLPHWPNGFKGLFDEKCIERVREKLRLFPYGQYIVGNVFSLAF